MVTGATLKGFYVVKLCLDWYAAGHTPNDYKRSSPHFHGKPNMTQIGEGAVTEGKELHGEGEPLSEVDLLTGTPIFRSVIQELLLSPKQCTPNTPWWQARLSDKTQRNEG